MIFLAYYKYIDKESEKKKRENKNIIYKDWE